MEIIRKIGRKLWKHRVLLALLALVCFTAPQEANALFDLSSVLSKAVYYPMLVIGWMVSLIGGMMVVLAAYLVQFVLIVNMQIIQSPIVAVGFPIMLSIANLLFVFGLIVIAVATILQMQSYGMKQALWKLLVIAIAVNFGLVIAGTILNISDSITMYMVRAINPSGTTASESWGDMKEFASTLAGAFQPQKEFILSAENVTDPGDVTFSAQAFNLTSTASQALLQPILGVILTVATLGIIVILLFTLAVVLMVRYLKLIFLLITLPVKWATWPFPKYNKFNKWWSDFFNQAVSPIPIVFSLWLAMVVLQKMSADNGNHSIMGIDLGGGGQDSVAAGLMGALGGIMMPLANNFLRVAFVAGIMMAGLKGSASFGAEFAKTGQKAVGAWNNRLKTAITSRASRTARSVGNKVKESTVPLQRIALQARQQTTARIGEAASRVSIAVQNRVLRSTEQGRRLGLGRQRTNMRMGAEIRDRNNNIVGRAEWDRTANDGKGDWMRDANGDLINRSQHQLDAATGQVMRDAAGNPIASTTYGLAIQNSKVRITDVEFTVGHGAHQRVVARMTRDMAANRGLITKDNKPMASNAIITTDGRGNVVDARATTHLVAEQLEHAIEDRTRTGTLGGQMLSRVERQARMAQFEIAEEAGHDTIMHSLGEAVEHTGETLVHGLPSAYGNGNGGGGGGGGGTSHGSGGGVGTSH